MVTEALQESFNVAHDVLANVKPDQLGAPTPCASWDVKELVNHMVHGSHWFGRSVEAGKAADLSDMDGTDMASIDFVASFDEGAKGSVAAFGAPGALDKMVELPFGTLPVGAFLGLATTDIFVHAWDLARATGQDSNLDPALAAQLLTGAKAAIPDAFRGPDGSGAPFGPQQAVPAGATPADELAAFLGRAV